uniref:T-cell receptor alpha/delta variable 30.0.6 n=1 Tax=Cyprinus carpio TaxID=7962 RepID=A0A8C2F280_CYPCA
SGVRIRSGFRIDLIFRKTRVQTAYEGGTVIINCTYKTSYSPTLFWYQQKVNKVPKYMLNRVGKTGDEDKELKDRFNAYIDTSSQSVPLTIKSLSVSDSAVYYCVLSHPLFICCYFLIISLFLYTGDVKL